MPFASPTPPPPQLLLVPIPAFDARRGYRRWVTRWVGAQSEATEAIFRADLWTDRARCLVTRFSARRRCAHYEVRAAEGGSITPEAKGQIEDFLFIMLMTWAAGGADSDPEGEKGSAGL